MATGKLTFPEIGEEFVVTVAGHPTMMKVQGPCEDIHSGHWYCLTHHKGFENQMTKDGHIHHGNHKLVWMCHRHGLEIDPKWGEK